VDRRRQVAAFQVCGVAGCQPDVVVEPVVPEIEQFFLTGEGETVEFKERLDVNGLKLPKTATAFANTKGGTIVFGMFVNLVRTLFCTGSVHLLTNHFCVFPNRFQIFPVGLKSRIEILWRLR
jgi:hypothetical protein